MTNMKIETEPSKEERILASMHSDLQILKEWAEEISGEWNGDNPGKQEERAHCAQDIIKKSDELKDLLDEMKELWTKHQN